MLLGKTKDAAGRNSFIKETKIVIPLNYLSNFWRSLEMPLINCKFHLELNWIESYILSSGDFAKSKITYVNIHVPIVTLSTKDSVNMKKQLSDGFKRSIYWNNYQTIPAKVINKGTKIYELLRASFQSVKTLFVLAHVVNENAANDKAHIKINRKYFTQRAEIEKNNALMEEIYMISQLVI